MARISHIDPDVCAEHLGNAKGLFEHLFLPESCLVDPKQMYQNTLATKGHAAHGPDNGITMIPACEVGWRRERNQCTRTH